MTHLMCTPSLARNSFLSRLHRLSTFSLIGLFMFFLHGCDASLPSAGAWPSDSEHYAVSATWDEETQTLSVSGKASSNDEGVEIHDADSNTLLGKANVKDDGTWSATATTNACAVHVALASGTVTAHVVGAPANCAESDSVSGGISARALVNNEEMLGTANPEPLAIVPNGLIVSPRTNPTIEVGQSVTFSSIVSSTRLPQPVSFFWNFGGAAPNTNAQNPGPVIFGSPGIYRVQLFTTDGAGAQDPTPATRTITVIGNTPTAAAPVPRIVQPTNVNGAVLSINVGSGLDFSGVATDAGGNNTFTYEWDFAGVIPTQFGSTPGRVTFSQIGRYVITLNVYNSVGVRSIAPATVIVVVGLTANSNQAPDSTIVSPRNDITINPGDSVFFEGRGQDNDNNTPLSYSWDFSGVSSRINNSPVSNGGTIRFQFAGIYVITFAVTDALGLTDPNPAIRVITVNNTGGGVNSGLDNIVAPPTNMNITPGASVFFSALAPGGVTNYQYFWNFSGVAPVSNQQTPGSITFPSPGVFTIELFVVDQAGNVVGVPSQRVITVGGATQPLEATIISPLDEATIDLGSSVVLSASAFNPNFTGLSYWWEISSRSIPGGPVFTSNQLSPGTFTPTQAAQYRVRLTVSGVDRFGNATSVTMLRKFKVNPTIANSNTIFLPAQDMVINVGGLVSFQAASAVGSNLTYYWDFGGAATPSTLQTPNTVFFGQPGTFIVTLQVTGINAVGQLFTMTSNRVITVLSQFPIPPGGGQTPGSLSAPDGSIVAPAFNLTIRVGTPVNFIGRGFDPTGSGVLRFVWSFGGATPNVISQIPGNVTFNRVGVYAVTLTVVNALGQYDPTPAVVVVDVTP